MAKGIPVIGRAPDKKAKIINVDELGNLKVSQLESKLDGIENKLVALEQKLTDGSQKVTLSGAIEVVTVGTNVAIAAGTTQLIGMVEISHDQYNVAVDSQDAFTTGYEILIRWNIGTSAIDSAHSKLELAGGSNTYRSYTKKYPSYGSLLYVWIKNNDSVQRILKGVYVVKG